MKRRVKGEGSWDTVVIKGKEYIRFRKKYETFSKPKLFYGHTKKEVKEKVEKFEATRHLQSQSDIAKTTVADYMLSYLVNVRKVEISCNYYKTLRHTFKNLIVDTEVGNMQMDCLNSSVIQNYYKELASKYSLGTIKIVHTLLKTTFDYAVRQCDIAESPLKRCKLPSAKSVVVQPQIVEVLSDEDMEKFFNEVEAVNTGTRCINGGPGTPIYRGNNKYILLLILYTGMRTAEALALTWDDYDREAKTLSINKNSIRYKDPDSNAIGFEVIGSTKTSAGVRIIPLPKRAVYALDKLYENRTCDRICATSVGTRPSNSHLLVSLHRICARADLSVNVKTFGLHDLRHTYASYQLRHGVDPLVVSKLLGHKNVGVTMTTYAHVIEQQKIKAIEVFDTD